MPQPTDARVPCPTCRAPIHPIAGRCKHCKADLSAVRQSRPAAVAALPPLVSARAQTPVAVPVVDPSQLAYGRVTYPSIEDAPILPPRPTGRMDATGTARRSSWKSWPVLVILLASVAIVVAVILMVFPPGGSGESASGKHVLEPPPAPDRMDTNPSPTAPHAQIVPPSTPDPLPTPRVTPPPVPPDPDPSPNDPFQGLGSITGSINGKAFGGPSAQGLMLGVLDHACKRMAACGASDPSLQTVCTSFGAFPKPAAPTCAAATRCFAKIDAMDCGAAAGDMGAFMTLMTSLQDCTEAMSC